MASRKDQLEAGRQFFRRLAKDGAYAPVFVFSGEERFLVLEALNRAIRAVFPEGRDDFNLAKYHASETKVVDVTSAANMVPMFASRRVVVCRGIDAYDKNSLAAIAEYANDPSPSTVFLLEAQKLDGRSKAVQSLKKNKNVVVVDFGSMAERDVEQWVARRAAGKGLLVARDVPRYLVGAIGTGLQELDLALDRVDLYIGDPGNKKRQVTLQAVQAVVSDTRIRSVFELVDALSESQLGLAMSYLDRMLKFGESPVGVVAMVARQFRILRLVREGMDRGMDDNGIAKFAGCPWFKVRDMKTAARRFDHVRLQGIQELVKLTDHALKSSRLPDRLHVERLFVGICTGSRRASA